MTHLRLYGLIGRRLSHSQSAALFDSLWKSMGIDARYVNFEIEQIELLPKLLADNPDLRGFNVTIPYKEAIIPYLADMSAEAREIGAVNTVLCRQGELIGYNTDVIGFSECIDRLDRNDITAALVLGTGGAAKAVTAALKARGIEVQHVSRSRRPGAISYGDINAATMRRCLLIVNCTPLGMYPDTGSAPDIPYEMLSNKHVCYDVVYNPAVTEFMGRSLAAGAGTVRSGGDMLRGQALAAWRIWSEAENNTDNKPTTSTITQTK